MDFDEWVRIATSAHVPRTVNGLAAGWTVNYGRAGGSLNARDHLLKAGAEVVDLELEVPWLVQWAQHHANWGA